MFKWLLYLALAVMYSGMGFFCTAIAAGMSQEGELLVALVYAGSAIWFAKQLVWLPLPFRRSDANHRD